MKLYLELDTKHPNFMDILALMELGELAQVKKEPASRPHAKKEEPKTETVDIPTQKLEPYPVQDALVSTPPEPIGPETTEVSLSDLRELSIKIAKDGKGRDVATILKAAGATKLTSLDPSKYADVYAKLEAL